MTESKDIVKPFKGLRYQGNLSDFACPPYDVIDENRRAYYENKHQFNFVKVILPRGGIQEGARIIKEWVKGGIVKEDEVESFYLLKQRFDGKERVGIFALVSFSAKIYPHERTEEEVVKERMELTALSGFNLEPIFLLADGLYHPKPEILLGCFMDDEGIEHELYTISNEDENEKFISSLKGEFLIADGHHRFQAYKATAERQSHFLAYITGEPKEVLPTHRLVKDEFEAKVALDILLRRFEISEVCPEEISEKGIFIVTKNGVLKVEIDGIPVVELHKLVDVEFEYEKDTKRCIELVNSGKFALAILLPPVSMEDIWSMARSGKFFPRKSTYFWPKVPSGLVISQIAG